MSPTGTAAGPHCPAGQGDREGAGPAAPAAERALRGHHPAAPVLHRPGDTAWEAGHEGRGVRTCRVCGVGVRDRPRFQSVSGLTETSRSIALGHLLLSVEMGSVWAETHQPHWVSPQPEWCCPHGLNPPAAMLPSPPWWAGDRGRWTEHIQGGVQPCGVTQRTSWPSGGGVGVGVGGRLVGAVQQDVRPEPLSCRGGAVRVLGRLILLS